MHPLGQLCLIIGSAITMLLGHYIGKEDLRRIKNANASLEGTPVQIVLIILCMVSVPGSLLALVIISGI